jgi:hypothetical protein
LKRQLPYLIGGTITGTFISYYYGFLFSIIVNSIFWFAISTIFNKYYWHYTGFKDEFYLVSKYIIHRKMNKTNDVHELNKEDYKKEVYNNSINNGDSDQNLLPKRNKDYDANFNFGSPVKL